MEFNMTIGESLDLTFTTGSSIAESPLLVGSAEIFADGITGTSGIAELVENI